MNERTNQLWKESQQWNGSDDGRGGLKILESVETFAELIVRDCMNIARNVGNISEPDDWALDRCYEIEQRIQDRFGVEE
jgi:hypothetical protein